MPSPRRSRPRSQPRARRLLAALALLLALLATPALAQAEPLGRLAPRDTVLALGLTPGALPGGGLEGLLGDADVAAAREAWARFVAAADELDLGDFAGPSGFSAMPGGLGMPLRMLDDLAGEMNPDAMVGDLAERCPDLASAGETLLGGPWADDLLATVAMDPFAPLPGVLALARVAPGAEAEAAALHDALLDCLGGEVVGTQDGVDMIVIGDGGDVPLVVARRDALYLVGTRPDLVRGALRRAAGADEPSLADDASYLAPSGAPSLRLTVRPDLVADVLEVRVPVPVQNEAQAAAVRRGAAVLRTLGSYTAHVTVTPDGVTTRSSHAIRRDGGDAELADLLACDACRVAGPFVATDGAVAASGTRLPVRATFEWLDGLVADLSPALGEPTTLRALLSDALGVDVDAALLDWIGDEVQTVRFGPLSTDLRDLLQQPPTLTAIPVESASAAEAGLEALVDGYLAVLDGLAAFDDDVPSGDDVLRVVAVDRQEVRGVPYHRVRVGPTTEVAVGVVGNRLVTASPAAVFETAVALQQGDARGAFASDGWTAVRALGGGDARVAWRYSDVGADLGGLADLARMAAQPLAFFAVTALDGAASRPEPATEYVGDGPRVIDLASAERYGVPNFAGDPGGDAFGAGGSLDLALAEPYGSADVGAGSPRDLDAPGTVEDGLLAPDAPNVVDGPTDLYRLPLTPAGTVVTVEMTSDAFDTYLYLIDPDAAGLLGENDDAPDTSRSEIRYVSDGETRPWIGAASWSSFGEGAYRLAVTVEAPAADAATDPDAATTEGPTDLALPGSVDGALGPDALVIDGSATDLYRLPVTPAGTIVSVTMTSDAFDTYLKLFDEAAEAYVGENDDAPDTSRSEIRYRSDGVTVPLVGATSWSSFADGPYRLGVEVVEAAAEPSEEEDGDLDLATFAELLPAFDLVPDVLDELASRIGREASVTTVDGDVVRSEGRLDVAW